jgi:hypothetical protein
MGWSDWLLPAGLWVADVFTAGALTGPAIAATAAAAGKTASDHASSEAANTQTQAGNQAISTQQQAAGNATRNLANTGQQQRAIYNNQVSNLDPYTSLGAGAANTLGGLLGIPITMPQRQPIPNDLPPQSMVPPGRPMGPQAGGIGAPPVPGMTPFSGAQPFQRPQPFGQPQPPQSSAKVKMRGPDGSVEDVDANLVPHYQSLGASVVQS